MTSDSFRLTRHNVGEEADRFAAAVEADAIWPEDFGRPALRQE